MDAQTHQDTPRKPPPSQKNHAAYVKAIETAASFLQKRFPPLRPIPDQITDFIIYTSFLVSDTEWWTSQFTRAHTSAARFPTNLNNYWKTIQAAVTTPQVEEAVILRLPNLDREKYFPHNNPIQAPQRITPPTVTQPIKRQPHKRGELWKLTPRWDHLRKSSHSTYIEMLRRTQYPKKPGSFPWCQIGVESLAKYTRYSPRQIKNALRQLEDFKLIKKIYRAYEGQGPSKYFVFITPTMSRAFSAKTYHHKKT